MDKQQREYIHHLMLQYSDAMVRLTYRRVGDWHLAEDLVQETFLTACCKSERVCGHKKPVAWLFETLNNLTLRESRRFYHTEVGLPYAKKFADTILGSINQLAEFPEMGAVKYDTLMGKHGFRALFMGNYVCVYRIEGDMVYVYHLADARKNYIYHIFGME